MVNTRVVAVFAACVSLFFVGVYWHQVNHYTQTLRWSSQALLRQNVLITIKDLDSALHRLRSDTNVTSSLDWNLQNSLQRYLQSQLAAGKIDQLHVLDERCKPLHRVSTGPSWGVVDCQISSDPGAHSQAHYTWLDGRPGITVVSKLNESGLTRKGYLAATIQLTDQWLARHGFDPLVIENFQSVTPEIPLAIREGNQVHIPFDLQVALVPRSLDLWLAPLSTSPIFNLMLFLISLAMVAVLVGAHRFGRRSLEGKISRVYALSQKWSDKLNASQIRCPGEFHQTLKQLERVQERALAVYDEQATQLEHCQSYAKEQHKQIQALQDKLHSFEKAQAELLTVKAFNHSVESKLSTIANELEQLDSMVDDVDVMAMDRLLTKFDGLSNLLRQWEVGINARGTRRYFRSLEETSVGDRTLLDEQIRACLQIHLECRDLLLNLGIHHRKLFFRIRRMQQWAINPFQEADMSWSIGSFVAEVNAILAPSGVRISLQSSAWQPVAQPLIPRPSLVQFVCDFVLATVGPATDSSTAMHSVALSVRLKNERMILILSYSKAAKTYRQGASRVATDTLPLELQPLHSQLAGLGVSLEALPSLDDNLRFALTVPVTPTASTQLASSREAPRELE